MKGTSIVRFNILTILMGLAVQASIQVMVQTPSSSVLLNGVAFLILGLNFYHGKIAATESETHQSALGSRPIFALLDFAFNIAVVGAFVAMPNYLSDAYSFAIVNVVMRVVDTFLVVASIINLRRSMDALERTAQWQWLGHNAFVLTGLLGIVWLSSIEGVTNFDLSLLVLLLMVLDVFSDYILNNKFYFGERSAGPLEPEKS